MLLVKGCIAKIKSNYSIRSLVNGHCPDKSYQGEAKVQLTENYPFFKDKSNTNITTLCIS